jgi:hypothetical protein
VTQRVNYKNVQAGFGTIGTTRSPFRNLRYNLELIHVRDIQGTTTQDQFFEKGNEAHTGCGDRLPPKQTRRSAGPT